MIGNWVLNPMNNKCERVQEIGFGLVLLDNDLYEYDEIKPIPITKDILERSNLRKFSPYGIKGHHEWAWLVDTQTHFSLWTRKLEEDTSDGWMIRVESPLVTCCMKVNYVHELQNILKMCKINKKIRI